MGALPRFTVDVARMSLRSTSPSSSRRRREAPRPASSPINRDQVSGQMQDIFAVVKKLREEKASLEMQLEKMGAHTETEERRLIKDLSKSRIDLENVADLFRVCADGIDAKSTANIPELPEAAVAKVVPRGLRPLLEQDYGDHASAGSTIKQEIGYTRAAITDTFREYEHVAEAGKGLLWDVERLNMIIQAYEQDLVALKAGGADMKANINAMRLMWRSKFSACRRWQDFTRRSHVLKFQEQLDDMLDGYDLEQAEMGRDLEAILEMIGTRRMRDNKAKLSLFLKKMKNAALYKVWRGWFIFHKRIQQEKYGDDLERLRQMEADKLAKMKSKETAAMLKCFIKRWQNRKLAVPWQTWAQIVINKREARMLEELERQRRAMFDQMSMLGESAIGAKLKLHFARLAGKMKDLTFRALVKNWQYEKMSRMGEDERFKRLKVFLEAKLKGVKFATFAALHREARELKARRVKNNSMANRVGAFLEMKIKGVKFAIMSSFKRHAKDSKAEKGEQDRLAALIAERDSQSLQRLKIFLQGKEMRMKYTGFSWWQKCTFGEAFGRMEHELTQKQKARKALEDQLRELQRELRGAASEAEAARAIADTEDRLADAQSRNSQLQDEIAVARKALKQTEAACSSEQAARREDKSKRTALTNEIADAQVDKEGLEKDLALIVDQIGFLSQYSSN